MILGYRDKRTAQFATGERVPAFSGFDRQAHKRLEILSPPCRAERRRRDRRVPRPARAEAAIGTACLAVIQRAEHAGTALGCLLPLPPFASLSLRRLTSRRSGRRQQLPSTTGTPSM